MLRTWWLVWIPVGFTWLFPLGCSETEGRHHGNESGEAGEGESAGDSSLGSGGSRAGRGGASSSGATGPGATGGASSGASAAGAGESTSSGGDAGMPSGTAGGSGATGGTEATGGGNSGGNDATGGSDAAGGEAGATGGSGASGGTAGSSASGGSGGTGSTEGDVRLSFEDFTFLTPPSTLATQIAFVVHLENHGTEAIALDEISVRYWYSCEPAVEVTVAAIDYCKRCTGEAVAIVPVSRGSSDHVLEVTFSGGSLAADPELDVEVNVHTNVSGGVGEFETANDWSADPDTAGLHEWERVTVYRNGTLIWGVEPPS